jgi:intron-binding protein aquarius
LQDSDPVDGSRLKRVVLIGDHHQLPPVVKHLAFQKFSKLDQSLFTRFVRLGVPTVQLDRQGRSRAEIAALYSWRYLAEGKSLGNLDQVAQLPQFKYGNAGFAHTVQLVNVPAFQGRGESCPTPYFYQNLGEAEYVVAVFQYMRLLGYPAEKISIITSYNGQKHLIRDIISQRCQSAVFGRPAHITTVDKFQGQQNDFVLLSLVRTETVGHLRDVRRLVVALSRARLGLYVFCRQQLFENCYELSPAFHQLLERPSTLQLVAGEGYPLRVERTAEATVTHDVADVTAMGVLVYQMVQQAQHAAE